MIVDEIAKCATMTSLRLEGNTVGVEAAEAIAEALAKHPEFQVCLFVLRFNIPVNNFSVMLGRSHSFWRVKCLAQGHNTAEVGFDTSRS